MKCASCHKDVLEGEIICTGCGKPVSVSSMPAQVRPVDNSPQEVLRYLVKVYPEIITNEALFMEVANKSLEEIAQGKFSDLAQGATAFTKTDIIWLQFVLRCGIPKIMSQTKVVNDHLIDYYQSTMKHKSRNDANVFRSSIIMWAFAMGLDISSCSDLPFAAALPPAQKEHATTKQIAKSTSTSIWTQPVSPLNGCLLIILVILLIDIVLGEIMSFGHSPEPVKKAYETIGPSVVNSFPQKGQPYTLNLPDGNSLEMLWCSDGSFLMGRSKKEVKESKAYCIEYNDETEHKVTLTQGFWLGKYEVTQAQYRAVMDANPSNFSGEDKPVEQVSWEEAMEYCKKLNHLLGSKLPAGYRFSLPTEAQWEYACRAGTTSALNSDQKILPGYALGSCANLNRLGWYENNSDSSTHPVGQKKPNAWGFYDMHGNVSEWCRDWYDSYSVEATDPIGPGTGEGRVIRGGSWGNNAENCRSACRNDCAPCDRGNYLGLRLVLAPVQ